MKYIKIQYLAVHLVLIEAIYKHDNEQARFNFNERFDLPQIINEFKDIRDFVMHAH